MKISCTKKLLTLAALVMSLNSHAKDHLIYSVSEDLPMGEEKEITRRNYYVNIGAAQGVSKGTTLNVFRRISKSNPYDNKRRVNYNVPIGQLEVIHVEEGAAIGYIKTINKAIKDPIFDINNFMIGDHVSVNIK